MKMRYKNNHNWINTKFLIYQNSYVAKLREIWNSGLKISEITDTVHHFNVNVFLRRVKYEIIFLKFMILCILPTRKIGRKWSGFSLFYRCSLSYVSAQYTSYNSEIKIYFFLSLSFWFAQSGKLDFSLQRVEWMVHQKMLCKVISI